MHAINNTKENFTDEFIESSSITDNEFIDIVKLGMQQVTGDSGTFRSIAHKNLNKLAGKTGTAQVFSLKIKIMMKQILKIT